MKTGRGTTGTSSDRARRLRGRRDARWILSAARLAFLVVLTLASDSSGRRGFARGLLKKAESPVEIHSARR